MIKAVLCDLGDTLINFHRIHILKAFAQGARETYDFLADDLRLTLPAFPKYHWYQQWSVRWSYLKSKLTGREFNSLDTLRRCSQRLGIPVPPDRFEELAWRWYKPLADQAKADPYAIPMLQELVRRDLKLAIVSNTFVPPSSLDRHLRQENLIDYFPLRVYSCDVGVRKPNPEIFHATLRKLAVRPSEAVFLGDSPSADIRGARGVGLFAILKIYHRRRFKSDDHTFSVRTLTEVPDIIDRINRAFFPGESP